MTSVNSPACLLARNRFYRNLPPGPDQKPVFSCQDDSIRHKRRQVTLCITVATPPGGFGTKGLWVDIALGSSSSRHISASKPASPADRGVK